MRYWTISLRGLCMGAADIIPGVSGGTVALILGIYPRFIQALSNLDMDFLKALMRLRKPKSLLFDRKGLDQLLGTRDFYFLVALGLGIAVAFMSLAKILPHLLKTYPAPMNGLFFGLILASVQIPYRMMTKKTPTGALFFGGAVLFAYVFTGLPVLQLEGHRLFLFGTGALAVSAMLLPGVSGSFLVLILGQYEYLLTALRDRNLSIILPFVAGMGVGVILFARIFRWLFRTYPTPTLAALAGLMVGSLRKIWPYKIELTEPVLVAGKAVHTTENIWPLSPNYLEPIAPPLFAALVGILIVIVLNKLSGQSTRTQA